ncbi:hypothetical protein [Gordonia sp. (in: high G+C Gram-positive bacteria)]|uniref:hypothetical protein n=1 Tax=Gordonia sp. (in: high G+C Gram-positive bacteria) TaxID=84139 RepID=UPI00260294DB|nr:hypothetical protein [Gordonia sp. (in: high G+C Gram-positive bacteria)]
MTRSSHAPRSAPPYREPIARGQTYPPLGFADDGTPRYGYTPPTVAAQVPVEPAPVQPGPPPPPKRDPAWRTVAGVASVLVLILVVAGALKLASSGGRDDLSVRSDPPQSQTLDDPYLDGNQNPDQSGVPSFPMPPVPGGTTPAQPSGPPLPTLYEVTTQAQSTVLYRDGDITKVTTKPGGPWSVQAVTTGLARITVLVGDGEAASCRITVDGKLVSSQQVSGGGSGMRLLVCQG